MARKVKETLPADAAKETRVFVYIGTAATVGGKLGHVYYVFEKGAKWESLDGLGTINMSDGEHVRLWMKPLATGRPGSVFEFPVTETPPKDAQSKATFTVWTNGVRWLETWHNDDEVTQWQAAHDATKARYRAKQEQSREGKRNVPLERLLPFRKAYQKLDYLGRSALLAQVVEYVTRGNL